MSKVRKMPKEGYYVYNDNDPFDPKDINVIYTTGVPGKGGHKYYRILMGDIPDSWATLLWTCVPGIKDLAENYTYYSNLPDGIPEKN